MRAFLFISVFAMCFLGLNITHGQVAEDSELFRTLKEKDSMLFHAAFNTCDTEVVARLFTKDLEFYHDKGGVTVGLDNFIGPMAENCARRKSGAPQPSKRILIEGSLRVFPLYENGVLYGAVQHGVHRFESLNAEQKYEKGDVAKFTHLWIKGDEGWKIKREISYDHQLMTQ